MTAPAGTDLHAARSQLSEPRVLHLKVVFKKNLSCVHMFTLQHLFYHLQDIFTLENISMIEIIKLVK